MTRAWRSPSAAPGWSVTDVVLHLAQTEEAVVATTAAGAGVAGPADTSGSSVDDADGAAWWRRERAEPAVVFERWRVARRAALDALRARRPRRNGARGRRAPLKPATLATTRLAEHWAHAPRHRRTRSASRSPTPTGCATSPGWATARCPTPSGWSASRPGRVHCELTAPDGARCGQYGPDDAESSITGSAGAFCRVGAQRLAPAASGLVTSGPDGAAALAVLRNYAA